MKKFQYVTMPNSAYRNVVPFDGDINDYEWLTNYGPSSNADASWLKDKYSGPPKESATYSVAQLVNMGMSGLYRKKDKA